MNPLRSVVARLSLALLVVVVGALAIVYLVVVPSLQSRLINSRLKQVEKSAASVAAQLTKDPESNKSDSGFFSNASDTTGARVVLFQPLSRDRRSLLPFQDSRGPKRANDIGNDPIAVKAFVLGQAAHGTVERGDERFAESAVLVPAVGKGWVLLLSAPLDESLHDVGLVRRRVLLAGGLVLLLVLVVGYSGSWMFARRIRRLERAADRIASGRFDEPITDLGSDEVGELAQAFERMRLRLAQLDHARREFIANASHELRTPLFSLAGFLELLADEELDEETRREFLATTREQVTRLTKLATELLDLSRLDAGQLDVTTDAVSLGETAAVVVEEFSAVARQTGHRLSVEASDPVVALADEGRVLQIARILVENALVHTPPGTEVQVTVGRGERGAWLAVVDDGPGIPADRAPHVFERFYRAEGSKAAGSGLGLAIARELARLMGGSVELATAPGRTVFTLLLPAGEGEPRRPGAEREPVPA